MAASSRMLTLWKFLLGPLLLLQGARLRRTALRLPEAAGPRAGQFGPSSGEPLRLLFIGDSSVAGVGVAQQCTAMPHQAAAQAARLLNRPIHWQSIAQSGLDTDAARRLLEKHPPRAADIIISALGVNDTTAQHSAARFITDYQHLLEAATQRTGARRVVVSGLPPMRQFAAVPQPLRWYLGCYAQRLDQALRLFCASSAATHFLALPLDPQSEMACDGFHPGPAQYRQWALIIAQQLAETIPMVEV